MIFKVKIQPLANKNEILEKIIIDNEEYLKIKIKAPAINNKANLELISFLSKILKIQKNKIKILKGEKSKIKILEILDLKKLKDIKLTK